MRIIHNYSRDGNTHPHPGYFTIISEEIHFCNVCHRPMKCKDRRERIGIFLDGSRSVYLLRRMYCYECHIMHTELPDFLIKFKHFEVQIIEDTLDGYITPEDCYEAPSEMTMFRWQAWFASFMDEWDFIFHRHFVTDEDRMEYIDFLSNLLKDQPYVDLAYMTGILPIAKYSSGSELNMFLEYTMASEEMFGDIFGFTESEVDQLFDKFLLDQRSPKITRNDLKMWYDGYSAKSGSHIYNPRSIVAALTNNNLGNYWTSSGPYDEIYYYIDHNTDAVRDSLALMVSGIPVKANVREYAATAMNLTSKDEIFSAMTVYGFLSFEKGCVRIPNRELMERFDDMLQKHPSLGLSGRT